MTSQYCDVILSPSVLYAVFLCWSAKCNYIMLTWTLERFQPNFSSNATEKQNVLQRLHYFAKPTMTIKESSHQVQCTIQLKTFDG